MNEKKDKNTNYEACENIFFFFFLFHSILKKAKSRNKNEWKRKKIHCLKINVYGKEAAI